MSLYCWLWNSRIYSLVTSAWSGCRKKFQFLLSYDFIFYWIPYYEALTCVTSQPDIWLLKSLRKYSVSCSDLKFACTLISLFNENICLTYTLGTVNVLGLCIKIAESNPYLFLNCWEMFSERNSIVGYLLNVWYDHLILLIFWAWKLFTCTGNLSS